MSQHAKPTQESQPLEIVDQCNQVMIDLTSAPQNQSSNQDQASDQPGNAQPSTDSKNPKAVEIIKKKITKKRKSGKKSKGHGHHYKYKTENHSHRCNLCKKKGP